MSDALKASIVRLLNAIGEPGHCSGCGKPVWWITSRRGTMMPINEQAENHYKACTNPPESRRKS